MHCAVYVPNFGTFGDVTAVVALAQAAEATGWDGFFIWDHVLPDDHSRLGPVADPWVLLTAIAGATTRIRLGALVTPLPRRRPWKLARETVTLDHLSHGRLVVGAGIGGDWWREYSAVGEAADARTHGAMLDEGLAVLTSLWTGDPVSYQGTHYRLDRAQFLPTPVQTPRIPIWIAGVWPGTRPFQRAARWDGVVPIGRSGELSPQDVEAMRSYLSRYRTSPATFDVVVGGRMYERTPAEAAALLAAYGQAGVTWWLESFWADTPRATVEDVIGRGPPQRSPT